MSRTTEEIVKAFERKRATEELDQRMAQAVDIMRQVSEAEITLRILLRSLLNTVEMAKISHKRLQEASEEWGG